ncbi:MAG: flippase [Cyanobacteria bacterium J06631_2]
MSKAINSKAVNKFKSRFKSRFVQQIMGSFGLRVTYTGCIFLTSIILARFLGATEFGIYSYTFAWSYLLGVFSTVGLDSLLVREVAVYKTSGNWAMLRGILRWANIVSFSCGVAIAICGIAIAWGTGMAQDPPLFTAFCLGMAALPFVALRNLRRGAMRGLQEVTLGLVPEMLIAPVVILLSILFAFALWRNSLAASWCIAIYTLVTVATMLISVTLLRKSLPPGVFLIAPQYQIKSWLASALPLMLIESIYVINVRADVLMLGSLRSIADAGIYVPVNRGAQLINFVLVAVSSALAPQIASLYAEGKLDRLQAIVIKTAKAALLPTLVITALLIAISPWYLSLFGTEFIQGKTALIILCLGQLIFTITGLGGLLLNMTGNEKYTAITGISGAVLNICLNYIFISRWGVVGAAIATSISMLLMNLGNIILVRHKLKIKSTAIGL